MMLSRTAWGETTLPVAFQTVEGRRAPWGCAAGAPYQGTASLLLLCIAHCTFCIAHCTLKCTLHTAYCTLHTTKCALQIAQCTL